MTDIDLFLDKENNLSFSITVEGSQFGKTDYRLIMEGPGLDLAFKGGRDDDGGVSFNLPPLKGFMAEGLKKVSLEVIMDDRIFTPMTFPVNLKRSVVVTAEAVKVRSTQPIVKAEMISAKVTPKLSLIESPDEKPLQLKPTAKNNPVAPKPPESAVKPAVPVKPQNSPINAMPSKPNQRPAKPVPVAQSPAPVKPVIRNQIASTPKPKQQLAAKTSVIDLEEGDEELVEILRRQILTIIQGSDNN